MLLVPQFGQVHPCAGSGFLLPHSGQNLLLIPFAPHAGQSQVSTFFGSGFFAPQSGQKRLTMPLFPQAGQFHPSAAGADGAAGGVLSPVIFGNCMPK